MTDYTILSNTAVGVGGLPSGATITALRDNPLAIAEGAPGAPRLQGLAAASDRGGLPSVAVSATDAVTVLQGAGSIQGTLSTNSTTFVVAHTYTINAYTGNMRFRASHRNNTGEAGEISYLYLYKNGVSIASFNTTSSTAVQRTVDASVALGDVFEWRHQCNFSYVGSVVSSVYLSASDGYIEQTLYTLSSEYLP